MRHIAASPLNMLERVAQLCGHMHAREKREPPAPGMFTKPSPSLHVCLSLFKLTGMFIKSLI